MTQSNLAAPNSITGNSAGSIWISDSGNNRVLRFDVAASKANGGNADGILGSTSYTSLTSSGTTRSSMDTPTGLTVDPLGRLYVADGANDRVLIFNGGSSVADGAGTSNVLGQPSFTDATARLSQSGFDMPYTPTWDDASQSLWVANLANNRVMRLCPPTRHRHQHRLLLQPLHRHPRLLQRRHRRRARLWRFGAANYNVDEGGGHIDVTVVRTGDLSGTTSVDYTTLDKPLAGHASQILTMRSRLAR